jgi:Large polyvalent protein associated domain 29
MTDRTYIDTKDAAVMVRKALKKAFPLVKFSVRISRYSGGSSISCGWVDGPTEKQVEAVTSPYGGRGFDGMTDSSTYHDSVLMPDGTVTHLSADLLPEGAQRVHFSNWAPSLHREYTLNFQAIARFTVEAIVGNTTAKPDRYGRLPFSAHYDREEDRVIIACDSYNQTPLDELIRSWLYYTAA